FPVALEALVNLAARAAKTTQLAAEGKLFLGRDADGLTNEVVVAGGKGQGLCVRRAGRAAEDRAEGLRDDAPGSVHADQGVGAVGEAEVSDEAGRLGLDGRCGGARGASGLNDRGQSFGSFAVRLGGAV